MLRDCRSERPDSSVKLRTLYFSCDELYELASRKCFIARHASGPEACDQCIRKAILNLGIEFPHD